MTDIDTYTSTHYMDYLVMPSLFLTARVLHFPLAETLCTIREFKVWVQGYSFQKHPFGFFLIQIVK